jgi:anti-sigma factor RsiW
MNHQQVMELLPWYVNATLKSEERLQLEAHLKECSDCAHELEQALELQQAVRAEAVPEPSAFQFTRALARVEEYEQEKASSRWWQAVPRFARLAMVAQLVMILALGGLLMRPRGDFTTATPPSAGARIVLGFQDGVTEQTVRQVVQEIRGNIVAGPSALGLYTIETPGEDAEALGKTIQKLRQNQRVIRVAALAP